MIPPADSDTQLGQCYNPTCSEEVEWRDGANESYCSWECAVEARSGNAQLSMEGT